MIDAGTIIDERYEVLSRVGSGGMADVYLARDQLLGRQVALKLLHPRFVEDQDFVERFRREASSAAGLSHPNVVGIFDRGEWNGTYYIAMEYLPGRSLKALVREQGPLEVAEAIDITIQILRAARFAHKRGIIHRDLTPHNVILDEEGRAKVTDFGIARAGASEMTLTGSIMGTAQYLSPEQAQGHAVSAASDLYAVGIVLYELLTGNVPFDGETAVTIALKQVSATAPPPSALNPAVSPALDAVVARALAKDPAARFADAEEFIVALDDVRRGGPPAAVKSHPAPVSGLAIPAAGVADGEGHTYRAIRNRWPWIAAAVALLALAAIVVLLLVGADGKVRVPDVTGQGQSAAAGTLRRAGLRPAPSSASSSTIPAGVVISERPRGGSSVARGSSVAIVISSGPSSRQVPDVRGLPRTQAVDRLQALGLKPTVQDQSSATIAEGLAIATAPAATTTVQVGSAVTVLLSSGPQPVKVPKLTGDSQAQAVAALTAVGLAQGRIASQPSTDQTPGTVLSQSPRAGASVPVGRKVDLVVAQAPTEVTVPSVLGQSEAQAAAVLGKAGFNPQALARTVTDATQGGIVLKQSPAAGRKARRGARVTITVGTLGVPTTTTSTTTSSTTVPQTTTTTTTAAPAPPKP